MSTVTQSEAPPTPRTPLLPPPVAQADREEARCCKSRCHIGNEVPAPEQWKMYSLLAFIFYLLVLMIVNLFISIYGAIVSPDNKSTYLASMGVASSYCTLTVPGSLLWFLPAYYTYRTGRNLHFILFIFFMSCQILFLFVSAIGIPYLGACGFFNGTGFFCNECGGKEHAAGVLFMILGFLWFVSFLIALFLFIMVVIGVAVQKRVHGAVRYSVNTDISAQSAAIPQ